MSAARRLTLLVFGAGSLAGEVVRSLAAHAGRPGEPELRIVLASRDSARVRDVELVALAHANALGHAVVVESVAHEWHSPETTSRLIAQIAPDLIFHAASLQSVWDLSGRWARFVVSHGYGVTLPLQLALAHHLQQALGRLAVPPPWVNACFPDLANACLAVAASSGPPPLCGVGNVALIAHLLRMHLRPTTEGTLRVIAAHAELSAFQRDRRADEPLPLAWLGEQALEPTALAALPTLPRGRMLNAFNAAEAARLLYAVLHGRKLQTHAPGPGGLPGGYPVVVTEGEVRLDLPLAIDVEAAVARNALLMERDGAVLDGDRVRFLPSAVAEFCQDAPSLVDGFAFGDLRQATLAMLALRSTWSSRP